MKKMYKDCAFKQLTVSNILINKDIIYIWLNIAQSNQGLGFIGVSPINT